MAGEERSGEAHDAGTLLGADDPPPFHVTNPFGQSPFLFIGDHAGNKMPKRLGTLGLSSNDRQRHIAWDIGIAELGDALAHRLDAVFIRQNYSRLVIDCNRDPATPQAIPKMSDGSAISANLNLTAQERAARTKEIHECYQHAIDSEISKRNIGGNACVLISLHSFTPALTIDAEARPWQIGILHNGENDDFAKSVLARLQSHAALTVGDNEPYHMDDTDYTVPRHAFANALPYVELEIRQDQFKTKSGVEQWAALLAHTLLQTETDVIAGPPY